MIRHWIRNIIILLFIIMLATQMVSEVMQWLVLLIFLSTTSFFTCSFATFVDDNKNINDTRVYHQCASWLRCCDTNIWNGVGNRWNNCFTSTGHHFFHLYTHPRYICIIIKSMYWIFLNDQYRSVQQNDFVLSCQLVILYIFVKLFLFWYYCIIL